MLRSKVLNFKLYSYQNDTLSLNSNLHDNTVGIRAVNMRNNMEKNMKPALL